jgi:Spy/CpxP family protein refolding chaperone
MRLLTLLTIAVGITCAQPSADQLQTQAQLQVLKTTEAAMQTRLQELRRLYKETHPAVVEQERMLQEIQMRERALSLFAAGAIPRSQIDAISRSENVEPKPVLPERWWKDPDFARAMGLTADQQKKMDDVLQQNRFKLIDLNAVLEKEEVTLEPLVSAEPLDEAKIAAQIDRVAQARAELEKANGRMLLGIRKLLTAEQWTKLSQEGFSLTPAPK